MKKIVPSDVGNFDLKNIFQMGNGNWQILLKKMNEFLGMSRILIVKVNAFFVYFHFHHFLMLLLFYN